jgi:methionyl-tRNA synthetase
MKTPARTTVTAALPYANGPLHIGHIAGAYLPADIYVRNLKAGARRCSLSVAVMSMARPSRCAH